MSSPASYVSMLCAVLGVGLSLRAALGTSRASLKVAELGAGVESLVKAGHVERVTELCAAKPTSPAACGVAEMVRVVTGSPPPDGDAEASARAAIARLRDVYKTTVTDKLKALGPLDAAALSAVVLVIASLALHLPQNEHPFGPANAVLQVLGVLTLAFWGKVRLGLEREAGALFGKVLGPLTLHWQGRG